VSLEQLHEGCLQLKKKKQKTKTKNPLKQPVKNAQGYSSQQHSLNVISKHPLS